eukprot:CAMPEP_0172496996 /NCGR_PEP_ID=MMETSP1066-20121228/94739_1 /TAXON_ID=671091 /ORGANISM="Coscinodiscus wailesii, Strain CCMP2513" /LENGTH=65 /DNA_ID=CAMNT_0013269565 /DNA_START=194 /DNA_END=391 /DNA_ORIENTATION=+
MARQRYNTIYDGNNQYDDRYGDTIRQQRSIRRGDRTNMMATIDMMIDMVIRYNGDNRYDVAIQRI